MRNWFLGVVCWLIAVAAQAQSDYVTTILAYQKSYRSELLRSANTPIKDPKLVSLIRFYEPDSTYRVEATVERTPQAQPFDLATYDGKKKPYVQYAVLTFNLHGKTCCLALFRSLELSRLPMYRDYLFLPFKDSTNGTATYGGGRYLDFRMVALKDNKLVIDFNKAYNPYCAYNEGFTCPIPPRENHLSVAIEAGEKTFSKK